MDQRKRRPGRILAPFALLGAIVALFIVVNGSGMKDSGKRDSSGAQTTGRRGHRTHHSGRLPTRIYKVKADDTLAAISAKLGIPVQKIEDLNPDLDPQSLIAGQRIKLK